MYDLGIFTGHDLRNKPLSLEEYFGKSGLHFHQIVRGIHTSPVKPNRIRKSLAAEQTLLRTYQVKFF